MQIQNEAAQTSNLIVVLPEALTGNMNLAHRVYAMAEQQAANVLYLALVENEAHYLQISRRLATMKAITSHATIKTHTKIATKNDGMRVLSEVFQPGDQVLCPQQMTVKTGAFRKMPMSTYLQNEFKMPVLEVSGFNSPTPIQTGKWIHSIAFWVVCLILLSLFTLLEIEINQQLHGTLRSVLFYLSLALEFGALLTWNHINPI